MPEKQPNFSGLFGILWQRHPQPRSDCGALAAMLRPGRMLNARCKFVLGLCALIGPLVGCEPAIERDQRPQEDWLARVGSTIALDDVVRYLKFQQVDTPEGDVVDVDNDLFQRDALDALIGGPLIGSRQSSTSRGVSSDVTKAWDAVRGGWENPNSTNGFSAEMRHPRP